MPTYLSPGVYVEEVDRGSKPIEGVGTAVAAFVGFTARSPLLWPPQRSARASQDRVAVEVVGRSVRSAGGMQ